MNIVDELSGAQDLPLEAMQQAARTPDRIAGGVLRVVEKAGAGDPLSEREQNLLFWGVHVLGQVRDTRLYRPLLALLARPSEETDVLLGDAITGTLSRVTASVFDGDPAPLIDLLANPEIDEFIRWNVFGALTFLTFDGRIDRTLTHDFLVRFDDERLARAGDATWNGWAEAIALLGFEDLAGRYHAALDEARLLDDVCDRAWFEAVTFDAREKPRDGERFEMHQMGYFGDAVDELDAMFASFDDEDAGPEAPLVNPTRDVGRNDPCPCGSGRKFKKCCLGREDDSPAGMSSALPKLPPARAR
jgi:uncharacterized protein